MYTVTLSRHAARSLRRIESRQREVIRSRIDIMDPRDPKLDVKKLAGRDGFRLRIGDWRVLYDIDDAVRVIAIEDVVQRGKAYR